MDGCRKGLCFDGFILKAFLEGITNYVTYTFSMLVAIRRNSNDQMFPLAWEIVEGENNDSLEWFIEELRKCFGTYDGGNGWTLVSQQKVYTLLCYSYT